MKFVTPAGGERSWIRSRTTQKGIQDGIVTSHAGEHEVLIKWSLQHPGIGNAKYRIAWLDVVGDAKAGLALAMSYQTVIKISTETEIKRPISFGDDVAYIQCEFFHVGVTTECK